MPIAARFLVGIDLGTTTTVVAYAARGTDDPPQILPIPQRVTASSAEARERLPSLLYIPTAEERAVDPLDEGSFALGEHARRRAAEVPGRAVVSPKSWLSYARIDRTAAVLPWGAEDPLENEADPLAAAAKSSLLSKISPVDASALLLARVKRAWDDAHPADPLVDQMIILTLPASFDEAARELTVLAATRAGLTVRLLEEPQAALYKYLDSSPRALPEGLVLVVDVGGGTTDLSLVRRADDALERVAVGRHLLLGGDNMDLALAAWCETKLDGPGSLDAKTFAQLGLACRAAKEDLYASDDPAAKVSVAVAGRGSQLVGRARTVEIARADLDALVTAPFLPDATLDDVPVRSRAALVAMGLPYERDVAITRHVAAFLKTHAAEPLAAVLLNGGVFRARPLADRILAVIAGWGAAPERLANDEPDLAVALGAVAYARALDTGKPLIGSGAAVGYYVATRDALGVCVVPRGAREGVRHVAEGRAFALTLGRPVRFDLFVSNDARVDAPGAAVTLDRAHFDRLPPLTLSLPDEARRGETKVILEGELSAIGTLDLACVELGVASPRRFRLTFDLRATVPGETVPPPPVIEAAPSIAPASSPPSHAPERLSSIPSAPRQIDEARARIDRAFRSKPETAGREVKDLLRDLEKILGDRSEWSMPTARALADALLPLAQQRRQSEAHERVYWLLTGFCLRPGFGDPLDKQRMDRLSPFLAERLSFAAPEHGPRVWQAFFVAARRVAAGLEEPAQEKLRDTFDPFLAPKSRGLKKPKKMEEPQSLVEMRTLLASLERVAPLRRAELGEWLVERTWTDRDPQLWADIARIGARVPTYASLHHVVAPSAAERWLDHLLRDKWENVPTAPRAALDLARRTGDRGRDISPTVRTAVTTRLRKVGADPTWIEAIEEVVATSEADRTAFYGEALPPGLRLLA